MPHFQDLSWNLHSTLRYVYSLLIVLEMEEHSLLNSEIKKTQSTD